MGEWNGTKVLRGNDIHLDMGTVFCCSSTLFLF